MTDQEKLDIIIARLEDVKALYQRYSESVPFVADLNVTYPSCRENSMDPASLSLSTTVT